MIIGLIILTSHFHSDVHNCWAVSVLATLILLSYTKILRNLIAAIYVTYLEYPTYNRGVWLYDANIDYLCIKRILTLCVGATSLSLPFCSLHSSPLWSVAAGYITPEDLCVVQQC